MGSNSGEGNRLSFVVSKDRMKGSNAICGLRFFEEQEVVRINLLRAWRHLTILFDINIVEIEI